jgi:hypothetical protein
MISSATIGPLDVLKLVVQIPIYICIIGFIFECLLGDHFQPTFHGWRSVLEFIWHRMLMGFLALFIFLPHIGGILLMLHFFPETQYYSFFPICAGILVGFSLQAIILFISGTISIR